MVKVKVKSLTAIKVFGKRENHKINFKIVTHYRQMFPNTKFGNRTILGRPFYLCGKKYVVAKCECGKVDVVNCCYLTHHPKTGCRECGYGKHTNILRTQYPKLWEKWKSLFQKCYNPNASGYNRYGARNVIVCDEWKTFQGFLDWALIGYKDGLTIDRFPKSNGNYEPSNCRWANKWEQARNTTNTKIKMTMIPKLITMQHQGMSLMEISRQTGFRSDLIGRAIKSYNKCYGN